MSRLVTLHWSRVHASQSRRSCRCECTSSSYVKYVWRSRRHSFVKELRCRLVRRFISCERRFVVLKWCEATPWAGGTDGDLPAVSRPFHLQYRRGCFDGNSSSAVVTTLAVRWWSRLNFPSTELLSLVPGFRQRQFCLPCETLTRLAIVLKLRLFLWVISVVLYIRIIMYCFVCQFYFH